jgi:hypothetical protein
VRHVDHERTLRGPSTATDWVRIIAGLLLIVVGALWTLAMLGTLLFGIFGVIEFDVSEQVTNWPSPAGAVVLVLAVFGVMVVMIGRHLYGSGRHPRQG